MPVVMKRNEAPRSLTPQLLRWGRRIVASAIFICAVIFLTGICGAAAIRLKWVAEIQLVPIILSVSVSLILLWLTATLVFGRIYCSSVCPMGYLQDIFARIPRLTRRMRSKRPYRPKSDKSGLRLTWLMLTAITTVAGMPLILSLFDPYAAFGRISGLLAKPAVLAATGQNVVIGSLAGISVAALTLIAIGYASFRNGRSFCNTFCPVGSALGLVSRFSIFRIDINTDRCIHCNKCVRACKTGCIDLREATVDMSRCVVCFDCLPQCDNNAIRYTPRRYRLATPLMIKVSAPQTSAGISIPASPAAADTSSDRSRRPVDRRRFLASGIILAVAPAVIAAEKKVRHFMPAIPQQDSTTACRPVTPPGIATMSDFLRKCISCGACVAACPANVIRLSSTHYGLQHPLHPMLSFDDSYCRYNCTRCSKVCPTGALEPLSLEEKHTEAIGLATVNPKLCIGCRKCVIRCPRSAITMVRNADRYIAAVDHSGCIGCGSCQYICPATPARAITVTGLQR